MADGVWRTTAEIAEELLPKTGPAAMEDNRRIQRGRLVRELDADLASTREYRQDFAGDDGPYWQLMSPSQASEEPGTFGARQLGGSLAHRIFLVLGKGSMSVGEIVGGLMARWPAPYQGRTTLLNREVRAILNDAPRAEYADGLWYDIRAAAKTASFTQPPAVREPRRRTRWERILDDEL
jgi:hypothetical protein